MKYFIRALKYFVYFSLMFIIIMAVLVLTGAAEGNISTMFKGGYSALWKIAAIFLAVSAVYPRVGFVKREIGVNGEWGPAADAIKNYMAGKEYVFEKETEDTLTFRHRGGLSKLARMYEDRITVTRQFGGATVEGLRKDVVRLSMGLENLLNPRPEE